jgi:hypothetical protein
MNALQTAKKEKKKKGGGLVQCRLCFKFGHIIGGFTAIAGNQLSSKRRVSTHDPKNVLCSK